MSSSKVLIVPGLGNSGPGHWQTLWEGASSDFRRVELGQWDRPHRNSWVNQLNLAIRDAREPVVLVAHSLGCLAVAWWARMEQPAAGTIAGALLVAPPEVDFFPLDERLDGFAPTPREPLPFRSILVASHNDPYISFRTARQLAREWGSEFVDAGAVGHINAASDLGHWDFGQLLLRRLRGGPEEVSRGSLPGIAPAHRASNRVADHFD